MSELLEQAIVDAEALKEAALKNAEQAVIEKYSTEVKSTVDKLLEQEMPVPPGTQEMMPLPPMGMDPGMDPGMGMMPPPPMEDPFSDVPMAHADGEDLCPCPEEEEPLVVDLGAIEAVLNQDEGGMGAEGGMVGREDLATQFLGEGEEIVDVDEASLLEGILETLKVDLGEPAANNLLAPLGGNSTNLNTYEEEALALENDNSDELDELDKENEKLNEQHIRLEDKLKKFSSTNKQLAEANEKINESNSSLEEENNKIKGVLMQMKERLDEVNFSNAKLLYMNRVLGSNSLNERQKTNIVEALSKADSIEGAKVIYETLQSTVGEKKQSAPKSLSEAVNRNPSMTLPRRDDVKPINLISDRWKKLAGINN